MNQQREPFPPRWLFFVLALVIIAGLGFTVYNQISATADKNTAQANSQTLAQDIQTICATQGKLLVDDRDLCAKAEKVQQNPTEAIPGPKGEPGNDGAPGRDGANGKDSTTPGPAGSDGAVGKDGLPGKDGLSGQDGSPGVNGADGEPGKDGMPGADGRDGTNGTNGADGAPGQSPTSFTFTDKTGTAYTCAPNPPGSSTYTCETNGGKLP